METQRIIIGVVMALIGLLAVLTTIGYAYAAIDRWLHEKLGDEEGSE